MRALRPLAVRSKRIAMSLDSGKVPPVFVPVEPLVLEFGVFGQDGVMLRQQARMKLTSSLLASHDVIGTLSVAKVRGHLHYPFPSIVEFVLNCNSHGASRAVFQESSKGSALGGSEGTTRAITTTVDTLGGNGR